MIPKPKPSKGRMVTDCTISEAFVDCQILDMLIFFLYLAKTEIFGAEKKDWIIFR